ncbi:MAG: hypothetical protein ACM3X9_00505 [Bacillota bacterium]
MPGNVGWNMENDKQINKTQIEQIKELFLSDDLLAKNVKPEIYSLPDEFARSRKNKSLLVYALLLLYTAAIGTGVYLLTTDEENKSKRVEVNIAEFRQFNLMELLAEKKENEEKLVKLQQELENLRAESMREIQKLSPKNQQKAIAELNEKMKKIEDTYKQQISSKEEALRELQKTISAEQQRINKSARETQQEIEKYRALNKMQGAELVRLNTDYETKIAKLAAAHQAEVDRLKAEIVKLTAAHQSEIDRLTKEYQDSLNALTLRYNPVYSHGEMAALLNSKPESTSGEAWNKFSLLPQEATWSQQEFDQLRKKIQNQRIIIKNLQNIPYTNSVPLAINRLDKLSQSIVEDYEALWGDLAGRLNEKNKYLNSYEYALNYLSMTRSESGFVIDARNPNQMLVFIDRIYSVKKGDTAYVFKNDDLPIAKIELNPEHGRITAKVKELLKAVKIEPFDKILLKLEVAQ